MHKTICYENKIANSCPAGTIIKYKVNDSTIVDFHVMYDYGQTMTMQSQQFVVNKTSWSSGTISSGPELLLSALENATKDWSNVDDQNYSLGITSLSGKGEYTGCSSYNSCTENPYSYYRGRTAKARLIILKETVDFGCTESNQSCPIWMYNYISDSIDYGGTINDPNDNYFYWTSSVKHSSSPPSAWYVTSVGDVGYSYAHLGYGGARAVVDISK